MIAPIGPIVHFVFAAHHAALIFPLAMFFACLALKDARRFLAASLSPFFGGEPLTPCWPKRIVFTLSPSFATTTWLLVGWLGVRFGLFTPATPARFTAALALSDAERAISDPPQPTSVGAPS